MSDDETNAPDPATLDDAIELIALLRQEVRLWISWSRHWEQRSKANHQRLVELGESPEDATPVDASLGPGETPARAHRWPWPQ